MFRKASFSETVLRNTKFVCVVKKDAPSEKGVLQRREKIKCTQFGWLIGPLSVCWEMSPSSGRQPSTMWCCNDWKKGIEGEDALKTRQNKDETKDWVDGRSRKPFTTLTHTTQSGEEKRGRWVTPGRLSPPSAVSHRREGDAVVAGKRCVRGSCPRRQVKGNVVAAPHARQSELEGV